MRKTVLFILAFGLQLVVFSQNDAKVKVAWGGEYLLPKKHIDLGFLGNESDGYIQVGHLQGKSLSLQRFDNSYDIKSEKIVNLREMPKSYLSEGIVEFSGKYYWFFSTFDSKENEEKLFVQEINVKNGSLEGGAKQLLSAKELSSNTTSVKQNFAGFRFGSSNKWNITKSRDGKSKLLIQYRIKPKEKRDKFNKDVIGLFVYDANMKREWGSEHEMPYTESEMNNNDYYVDKIGNVLLIARVKELETSKDKKKPSYHFEILKWSKADKMTQIIPFTFENKFGKEVEIAEDNSGLPLIVGYYSKMRSSGSSDGFFLLKVNIEQNKVENVFKGTYEFPSDVIKQFESARAQEKIEKKDEKDESEVGGLRFRDLTILEDGSMQITGEQYHFTLFVQVSNYGPRVRFNHYFEDIYTARVGADGELKFVTKIPKLQRVQNDYSYWVGGMSIKSLFYKGKLYLLFLDNAKNLNIKPELVPAAHVDGLGGVLTLVSVDGSGKTSKSKLFDFREEDRQLIVTQFSKVGDNQLISRTLGKKSVSKPFVLTFE